MHDSAYPEKRAGRGTGNNRGFSCRHNMRYSIIDLASEETPLTDGFDALVILAGP